MHQLGPPVHIVPSNIMAHLKHNGRCPAMLELGLMLNHKPCKQLNFVPLHGIVAASSVAALPGGGPTPVF